MPTPEERVRENIDELGPRNVLSLFDRANLGRQALAEFHQFVTPDTGRKFTELYNVQHLTSNHLDPVARVTICSIQRLYAMLRSLFFWLNKRMPQREFARGDRPRAVRVLRSVWNAVSSWFAPNAYSMKSSL